MKSLKLLTFNRSALNAALASALALAGTGLVSNAYAADASSTATATVATAIAITTSGLAVLSFGKFLPTSAGTTVIISNSGARTGTATMLATGTVTAARFNVTGQANNTYTISHSGGSVLSNGTAGAANEMALGKTSDLTGGNVTSNNVSSGTLSSAGAESIYVGGTLTVGANQTAGTYTGTVTVTVAYN